MTDLPHDLARRSCVDCGDPVTIYPPEDGHDTKWRCGRCAHLPIATPAQPTGPLRQSAIVCDGCHQATGHIAGCAARGRHQHHNSVPVEECVFHQEQQARSENRPAESHAQPRSRSPEPPGHHGVAMNHLYDGVKVSRETGELCLSTEMMGILCGLTAEEGRAEFERQAAETGRRDTFVIPPAWRRGAKELQARMGTTDFTEIILRLRAEDAAKRNVN